MAEIQTQTESAARARKICVLMLLLSDFPATLPGLIRRPKYTNSWIASAFRYVANRSQPAGNCFGPLDFLGFPTTLSQCFG